MYKKSYVILAIAVCIAMIMTAFSGSMAEEKQIRFVFGAQQNIKTVDPCVAYDATSNTAVRNFYDSIVMLGKSGPIEPGVAKSWSVSPDGLKYTFNTNPGIKFHDGTLLARKRCCILDKPRDSSREGYVIYMDSYNDGSQCSSY